VDVDQQLGGKYLLREVIGRGAMGQVFAGIDQESGEPVAVKVLRPELVSDPEAVARFMRERQILTSIDSPAIVRVIDLVAEGETLAIIMELIRGQDLRRYLRAQVTLPPAEAVGLAVQLLHGLAAVHAAGVVHRDVKPENLLLDTSAGQAVLKVTDFGVARLSYGGSLTKMSSLIGTPEYMAPELAEGGSAGPAADLYSAGAVLYEMLSGRTPFAGGPPMTVLRRHADMAPPPVPGVPAGLWEQVSRLLMKDPASRPASAADAAEALASQADALAPLPALPPMATPTTYQPAGLAVPDGGGMTVVRRRGPADLGAGSSPGAGGKSARSGNRRRQATVAAVAVAVIAAAAIILPSWLHHGSPPPARAATAAAYSFVSQQYPGGLRLTRRWTLSGPGGSEFTETVTASGAETAMVARFDEAIPPVVAGSLGTAQFSPPTATIVQARHAVEWQVQVPAGGSVTVSYRATVPAGGAAESRLAGWARDLGTVQAALPAPRLSRSSPPASPTRQTPTATPVNPTTVPTVITEPGSSSQPAQGVPNVPSYISAPLATGSSSITARVYFGQLSSVIAALSGQVTFNTAASLPATRPGLCVETVIFSQVTSPTGAVFARGLGTGWTGAESVPSQDTQGGYLHQQLVIPPVAVSAGEAWQPSASLSAGNLKIQAGTSSLVLQGENGSARTWLVNGEAVKCDA
jgi:Protein kinase domain